VTEAIKLTIPPDRSFHGVARLVVGGLAARLDLSYENLEDLQLALESLLANKAYLTGEEVTVELVVGGDSVMMAVGPLDGEALRPELERVGDGLGLARLLSAVGEGVALERRGDADWLRFEKRIPELRA
jgi:hypothetical protein